MDCKNLQLKELMRVIYYLFNLYFPPTIFVSPLNVLTSSYYSIQIMFHCVQDVQNIAVEGDKTSTARESPNVQVSFNSWYSCGRLHDVICLVFWLHKFFVFCLNWASEASPTLGCSIEISRDICMYICRYVSYVKLTA